MTVGVGGRLSYLTVLGTVGVGGAAVCTAGGGVELRGTRARVRVPEKNVYLLVWLLM